jgi:hypothetical protein
MLAFGQKRLRDIRGADIDSLKRYALKSSIGFPPKKSGDYPSILNPINKSRLRRCQKKQLGASGKKKSIFNFKARLMRVFLFVSINAHAKSARDFIR